VVRNLTVTAVDIGARALRRLGKRVQQLRRVKGLSQEAFALEAELARSYVSGVERGERNPSFKIVVRIAATLDVTVSKLTEGV
jgi:transcriptional regulator with XRE-family HTH domain